ncbi:MAG: amidohydrolase [Actinomycetota bacterium]|nr:amidohydrolase [Actinomycetota bacterium]
MPACCKDGRLPAVDFHQHLWPEPFIAALGGRSEPPLLRGGTLELASERPHEVDLEAHRLDERLRSLDEAGIDVAVVSCQPTLGIERLPADERRELFDAYHEGILELAAASDGRIRPLAAEAVVEGTVGACVAADRLAGGVPEVDALFDELDSRDGVVFVHPGPAQEREGDPPWWPAVVDYTAQMQAAYAAWLARGLERWPRVRIVFAILAGGGPIQLERLRSRGVDIRSTLSPNVFFEASSYGRRAFELAFATYGVSQLVYGSDAPVIDQQLTLREVQTFGDACANAVVRDNPTKLLS